MNKKFRVYDKVEKQDVTISTYWLLDRKGDLYYATHLEDEDFMLTKADPNRYIVEYSTGELDKNKKEIFEGDVCTDIKGHKGSIIYLYGFYNFAKLEDDYNIVSLKTAIVYGEIEITGNIHEED